MIKFDTNQLANKPTTALIWNSHPVDQRTKQIHRKERFNWNSTVHWKREQVESDCPKMPIWNKKNSAWNPQQNFIINGWIIWQKCWMLFKAQMKSLFQNLRIFIKMHKYYQLNDLHYNVHHTVRTELNSSLFTWNYLNKVLHFQPEKFSTQILSACTRASCVFHCPALIQIEYSVEWNV